MVMVVAANDGNAAATQIAAAKMAAFPVRRGSYQQPSATRQKKAEAKKRESPCTPFREKAKGKESDRRVLSRNRLSRADARATARSVIAPYPGLDRLVAAALDADLDTAVGAFNGSADDRRIWASIAWRVGVEEFHFALMDKLVVKSRAGDAGGPLQTSFRKVKYLRVVDPVPLAQTSDGKCKIMSFKDGDSATDFTYGHDWTLEGSGLYGDGAPEGEWAFDYATFHVGAEDLTYRGNFEGDGTSSTLTPLPDQHITPGTYENVAFKHIVTRDGATETLTLTIPTLTVT